MRRPLFGLAQHVLKMTDTITKSAAKIGEQTAEIDRLTEAVRGPQASEKLTIARMEAAVRPCLADADSRGK
jgi:hypothetical protein